MEKVITRNIAIYLSFIQLFANTISFKKNENKDYNNIPKSSNGTYIEIDNNNIDIPVFKRVNPETGEQEIISIFDDLNISSKQYGASQNDFQDHFEELIKDPIIWEEVQKYYPVSDFYNEDVALYFYKLYFGKIYECGCGHAAAADYVFHLFEGREEEFYNHFGYSMYIYRNGKIDFNYEVFMLKFFNYSILECNRQDLVKKSIMKEFYEYQMLYLRKNSDYMKDFPSNKREWTTEDWDRYKIIYKEREKEYERIKEKYEKLEYNDLNLGIPLEDSFGHLSNYLSHFGVNVSTNYKYNTNSYNVDDIIAPDNFVLYNVNSSGTITSKEDVDLHYVYVTGIDENGNVIVSSWGEKYYLDYSTSQYIGQILLKAK